DSFGDTSLSLSNCDRARKNFFPNGIEVSQNKLVGETLPFACFDNIPALEIRVTIVMRRSGVPSLEAALSASRE
ncbi:MAG: hypothetical protein QOG61_1371, partial [Candidatus Binataceae bacterium]|nr:hypothetical protein [Candidatus Binataceae bacterium]